MHRQVNRKLIFKNIIFGLFFAKELTTNLLNSAGTSQKNCQSTQTSILICLETLNFEPTSTSESEQTLQSGPAVDDDVPEPKKYSSS